MDPGSSYRGYDLYHGAGELQAALINTWTSNAVSEKSTNTVDDGNWHHVVVTYDGSSTAAGMKLYIDGSEESVTAIEDGLSATTNRSI